MKRFHNLDFLRSFAMIMGLFIHAHLLFLMPDIANDFQIEDIPQPENWVFIITDFISNWRMPLFFLLSGFFSILVIERKGKSYFIKDRVIRIGLTCLIFSSFYDIIEDGTFDFTTSHLWFLYELMLFILFFSFLHRLHSFKKIINKKIPIKIFFIISFWLVFTVPLAHILNNSFHPLAINPPITYFDLKLGNLVYYFSYFLVGVLLYSNHELFNKLADNKVLISLAFLAILAYLLKLYSNFLTFEEVKDFTNIELIQFNRNEVLFNAFSKGINSIMWSLFLIGFSSKFVKSDNIILKWFVELSYPIYVLHVFPLVILSALFYYAGMNQVSIFFLSIITGFIICVTLYYVFIKFTPLNWLIHGYHKSFLKFKLK